MMDNEFIQKTNFRYEVKKMSSLFSTRIKILIENNTGNINQYDLDDEACLKLSNNETRDISDEKYIPIVDKLVANNKILIISDKAGDYINELLNEGRIVRSVGRPCKILKRAFGVTYVEYFGDRLWGTDSKGMRKEIKINKVLSALGYDSLEIENVVNLIKMRKENPVEAMIQVTRNIHYVYDMPHKSSGTIGSSCMLGKGNNYDALVYNTYDNQLQIAYYKIGETLYGRALLWETDCGTKIMDRIYFDCDETLKGFQKWGLANGYLIREDYYMFHSGKMGHTCYCDDYKISLKGSLHDKRIPYMDTFKGYSEYNGYSLVNNTATDYELTRTNPYEVWDRCSCVYCGDTYHNDDMYCTENGYMVCPGCLDEFYTYTHDTNNIIERDRCYFTEDTERFFECRDDLFYAEDTGNYFEKENNVYWCEQNYTYVECNDGLAIPEDGNGYWCIDDLVYDEETDRYYIDIENKKED